MARRMDNIKSRLLVYVYAIGDGNVDRVRPREPNIVAMHRIMCFHAFLQILI